MASKTLDTGSDARRAEASLRLKAWKLQLHPKKRLWKHSFARMLAEGLRSGLSCGISSWGEGILVTCSAKSRKLVQAPHSSRCALRARAEVTVASAEAFAEGLVEALVFAWNSH